MSAYSPKERAQVNTELHDQSERNYESERSSKLSNLATRMVEVKEARIAASTKELIQIAQVMVFCALPYRRTAERAVIREARSANGDAIRVTFRAQVEGVDLPFGSDRTLLHWITHRAIVSKSAFIPVSSTSSYLREMGMSDGGKNIKRTAEAFRRIASFAIIVQRDGGGTIGQLIMPIIRSFNLPKSMIPAEPGQLCLLPSGDEGSQQGFMLDDAVFTEFSQHHVPTLRKLLEVTRESPQIQDAMIFLQCRSFSAREESLIPWNRMRLQFHYDDSNPWRIRQRFAEAITALRIAWPSLNAEATTEGLRIGRPKLGNQFLVGSRSYLQSPPS